MASLKNFFFRRKSLAEKLIEIVAEMPRLTKNGHRADFNYLEIVDLANAFYGCAKDRGIIVIPNDLQASISSDGECAWVQTEFEVTDGKERWHWSAYGFGKSEGKWGGLPIAQTMALKSWLKRLGMVFGEEDDAEYEVRGIVRDFTPASPLKPQAGPQPVPQSIEARVEESAAMNAETEEVLKAKARRQWNDICHKHGKTPRQRRDYLRTEFGVKDFAELDSKAKAEKALHWANGTEPMEQTLATSAKVQPISEVLDAPVSDEIATGD